MNGAAIMGETANHIQHVIFICAVLFAVERIRPVEKKQPLKGIVFNLLVAIVLAASTQVTIGWLGAVLPPLPFRPFLTIEPPTNLYERIGCDLLVLFIYDFFAYWLHRIEHGLPFLWRIHRLHHEEKNMNVSTTNRHNPLEALLRVPFIMLPMVTLFDLPFAPLVFGVSLGVIIPSFSHMNLRLQMGWMTALVTGPQLHRLHHSAELRHQDKNFANIFPFWDILFGTYLAPEPGEFPRTGLCRNENSFSDLNERQGSIDKSPNLAAHYFS